jgi:hypothetical protein
MFLRSGVTVLDREAEGDRERRKKRAGAREILLAAVGVCYNNHRTSLISPHTQLPWLMPVWRPTPAHIT